MRTLLSQYPECSANNFSLPYFKNSLAESDFILKDYESLDAVTDSGNNLGFGFHQKGEKMYLMPYYAQKTGQ